MPSPTNKSYAADSGQDIYGGRHFIGTFNSITSTTDGNEPYTTPGQTLIVELHGSGGSNLTQGRQYRAVVSGNMAYSTHTTFAFNTVRTTDPLVTKMRPVDNYGTYPSSGTRESMWLGFKKIGSNDVKLITHRRLEALMEWAKTNIPNVSATTWCLLGGSMGGWGSLQFGLRHPTYFPAIYPDRPRWRYNATIGNIAVPTYDALLDSVAVGSAPNIHSSDGGGSMNVWMDNIAYVSDTTKSIPWIGWCVGRLDGYTDFTDHVAAVAALRTAKRAFCFCWDNSNHSGTAPMVANILSSYPYGTFDLNVGYPLFTSHSLDNDPSVDLAGSINLGLKFRNVSESASSWSCEVTSTVSACTVQVEPISKTFTKSVSKQTATITAANSWVTLTFT
jgi:hypothetical protein